MDLVHLEENAAQVAQAIHSSRKLGNQIASQLQDDQLIPHKRRSRQNSQTTVPQVDDVDATCAVDRFGARDARPLARGHWMVPPLANNAPKRTPVSAVDCKKRSRDLLCLRLRWRDARRAGEPASLPGGLHSQRARLAAERPAKHPAPCGRSCPAVPAPHIRLLGQ